MVIKELIEWYKKFRALFKTKISTVVLPKGDVPMDRDAQRLLDVLRQYIDVFKIVMPTAKQLEAGRKTIYVYNAVKDGVKIVPIPTELGEMILCLYATKDIAVTALKKLIRAGLKTYLTTYKGNKVALLSHKDLIQKILPDSPPLEFKDMLMKTGTFSELVWLSFRQYMLIKGLTDSLDFSAGIRYMPDGSMIVLEVPEGYDDDQKRERADVGSILLDTIKELFDEGESPADMPGPKVPPRDLKATKDDEAEAKNSVDKLMKSLNIFGPNTKKD